LDTVQLGSDTVSKVETKRRPGQRAGLTYRAVLDAASAILSEAGGLDGLSIRAVAARLGVSPNALYSHIDGKDGLLDALIDDALAAVRRPATDAADPLTALSALLRSTYEVLGERAELIPVYLLRQGATGPNARALGEIVRECLARAGVEGERAEEALHVLVVHTIGFAAFDGRKRDEHTAARFDRSLDWLLAGVVGG
jgi:AcrR family transcriptional regulator